MYFWPEKKYYFGTTAFLDVFKEFHNKILAVVHGHVHNGALSSTIGSTTVINPGGLVYGYFGEMEIEQGLDGKWKIGSLTKHYL